MHYVVCRGRSVGLLVSNIEHAGTVDANRPRRDQAGDRQRSDYPRCRSCVNPVCSAGQDIENAVLIHGGTVEIVSRLRNGCAEHSWLYQRERTLADPYASTVARRVVPLVRNSASLRPPGYVGWNETGTLHV